MVSQDLNCVNWNLENGLSSNETYCVTQDHKGFIWICSDHGVLRYDGQSFEMFSTSNGLTENTVFRIYQDYKNRLWFLGMSGTLCYWTGDTIIHHPANQKIEEILNYQSLVTNMAIDSNDVIYFTAGRKNLNGYYRVGVEDSLIYFTPLEEQHVETTNLLLINDQTTLLLSRNLKNVNGELWQGAIKKRALPIKKISDLKVMYREYQPNCKKEVFYKEDTIIIYDRVKKSMLRFNLKEKHERIHSVYLDKKERLWISTGKGVFFYDEYPSSSKKPQLFLKDIPIATTYQDRQGNYWISTLNQGVFFISDWDVRHFFKEQLSIIKLVAFNNQIWGVGNENLYQLNNASPFKPRIITISSGVDLFDIKVWKEKLLLSNLVTVELDGDDLTIDKKNKMHPYSIGKTLFINGYKNYMMLGCSWGAYIFKDDSIRFLDEKYWINSIQEKIGDGWFWGTTEGLVYYDKRQDTIINLGEKNPLLSLSVFALIYFQGNLLVGTKGNGVLVINPRTFEVIEQWTNLDGLSSVFIHCLTIEDDSTIWVGSNQGADRLVSSNGQIRSTKTFDVHNYLPSNGVNDILIQDSTFWFATDNGIAQIPKTVLTPSKLDLKIPIYINEIHVNGNKVALKEHYSLTYNQKNIIVDFLALSFNANSMNYRYQLQNTNKLSDHWVYATQPHISYNNLEPDRYILTIQVKPKNGIWQQKGVRLYFEITPHFTETWGFFFLILSSLLLIVVLYVRYLIKRKNIEKELAEAEQKSLRSQLKPHFLFNAINSVVYFLYKNQKRQALRFLQKFAALMRSTLENTQHPLVLLEQDIKHLQLYLDMEYERLSSGSIYKHDFSIKISEDLNKQQWKIPPMLIQPLVENAIIHGLAPKEGDRKLLISVKEMNGHLIIWVEDNGIGRMAAKEIKKQFFVKKTSQGLKMLDERIKTIYKLLNVQIKMSVEDILGNPNCSTRFIVSFPKDLKNK